MSEYRAVVVGCGGRSGAHIEAYDCIEGAQAVACCAPTGRRRDPLADKHGLSAYAEAAEMIQAEKPDIVHLVTWPDTRVELMTLVSEMGVPACTVEKPVATGVADWEQLCDLARTTSTKFAISHQCRWQPNFVRCTNALQSGDMGDVKLLDFSAGMNIAGQGTHILNYAMALNGNVPVTQVFGGASGMSNSDPGHPGPDSTIGYLTFANGVRGMWNNGPTAPRCGDPDVFWQHVRVAAYADRGRVNWEEFGKWEIVSPQGAESGDFGGMDTWAANNLLSQTAFHQAMVDWLQDDTRLPGTNLNQSLHEWKVVLALYASALWNKPVEIESFEPPHDLFTRLSEALCW